MKQFILLFLLAFFCTATNLQAQTVDSSRLNTLEDRLGKRERKEQKAQKKLERKQKKLEN